MGSLKATTTIPTEASYSNVSTAVYGPRRPFVAAAPLNLNRTAALDHLANTLCAARALATIGPEDPWPIAWSNVPVRLVNRGVGALEPLGVSGSTLLAALLLLSAVLVGAVLGLA